MEPLGAAKAWPDFRHATREDRKVKVTRFRIDFRIQELDCPPEESRGVSFGDEVDTDHMFDFFNRCRDAVVTLFTGKRPKIDDIDPIAAIKKVQDMEREMSKRRPFSGGQPTATPKHDPIIPGFGEMWGGGGIVKRGP